MAKLNIENFSESFQQYAPMQCSVYLFECLDKEAQTKIKEDWEKCGGSEVNPWWEWLLENIKVTY